MILAALKVKLKIIGWNYDLKYIRCLIKTIIFCCVFVQLCVCILLWVSFGMEYEIILLK